MKRAAFVQIVGIEPTRFNLLKQRDQLPFPAGPDHEGAAKWTDYTMQQAFALRVMLDLLAEGASQDMARGLGPGYSAKVAYNALQVSFDEALRADAPVWVGVVALYGETLAGEIEVARAHFCGPLAELADKIASWDAAEGIAYRDHSARTVYLANATAAARQIARREAELTLPEAEG